MTLSPCITFEALGDPKGQPRPRAFSLNGQARIYDAGTAEGWKSQVAAAAKPCIPFTPLKGPLRLSIIFRFRRPKGHLRTNGFVHARHSSVDHTQKPDLDNLAKAVMDAMSILKFWEDDSQVCNLTLFKCWGDADETPGAIITLQALTTQERVEALPLFKQKDPQGRAEGHTTNKLPTKTELV